MNCEKRDYMGNYPHVICLAGATGTGKTAVALQLAQYFGGEIVNVDSRQVYRDFPVITAQPNSEELATVPHHFYGFLETADKLSAGSYAKLVLDVVSEITARDKVPILVGGTGLYFKALLEGIVDIPHVSADISEHYLIRCDNEGSVNLHAELQNLDPKYAAKIHPNDKQRILRALEVFVATGKNFTWWHENGQSEPFVQGQMLGLEIPLSILRPRLDERIEAMLANGALEEAEAALNHCSDQSAAGWSSIGCAELLAFLRQKLTFDNALELWRSNTKAYAKRQYTWFRAVKSMQWFSPEDVESIKKAINLS